MKLVVAVGLVALLAHSVSCDFCHNCKVKVKKYGQAFCSSFGHTEEETDQCLDFLDHKRDRVNELSQELCRDIHLCPALARKASASSDKCTHCKLEVKEYAIELCGEFVSSGHSDKCQTFLEKASLLNYRPVCTYLDQ